MGGAECRVGAVVGWRWGTSRVGGEFGEFGKAGGRVWVRGDRAAGAGDEERVLGTMRRSRDGSVSGGVGVWGVAVALY